MFFVDLDFIRELPNNQRLTSLIETICGKGASDSVVMIDQLQRSLIALKRRALHVSAIGGHPDLVIEEEVEPGKVVISKIADGAVFKRVNGDCYNAFDFLSDYLGLDREIPISMEELDRRYGKLLVSESANDFNYIADMVAMALRREIYGLDNLRTEDDVPPRALDDIPSQYIDELK